MPKLTALETLTLSVFPSDSPNGRRGRVRGLARENSVKNPRRPETLVPGRLHLLSGLSAPRLTEIPTLCGHLRKNPLLRGVSEMERRLLVAGCPNPFASV